MNHRLLRALCLGLVATSLFGCDHATKIAAKATLENAAPVAVAPHVLRGALELRYVENDDIAFSVFHRLGGPPSPMLLAALASMVILLFVGVALVGWVRQRRGGKGAPLSTELESTPPEREAPRPSAMTPLALALILGGALGNLVDRLARGYVVDFIHVRGWPVFNVADIAVVLGVALLALTQLRARRRRATA